LHPDDGDMYFKGTRINVCLPTTNNNMQISELSALSTLRKTTNQTTSHQKADAKKINATWLDKEKTDS
jgi:hypothetical protein